MEKSTPLNRSPNSKKEDGFAFEPASVNLKRRKFLKNSLLAVGSLGSMNYFLERDALADDEQKAAPLQFPESLVDGSSLERMRVELLQALKKPVAERKWVMVIDQHALHESMMYETLRRRVQNQGLESQRLLLPENFDVTETQAEVLAENADLIAKLGIELTPFGPKTYAIQAFPVLLEKKDVQAVPFIQDLIDILAEKRGQSNAEDMLDDVLNMTACKAAIKAGQRLSDEEIRQLLADRRLYESISRCPHGRPTTIKFTKGELEKQFKRT